MKRSVRIANTEIACIAGAQSVGSSVSSTEQHTLVLTSDRVTRLVSQAARQLNLL